MSQEPPIEPNGKTDDSKLSVEFPSSTSDKRRSSSVNFKEQNGLIEVDIEQCKTFEQPRKPHPLKSARYYIVLMTLISPFVTTYSRGIINFAITDMIAPEVSQLKLPPTDFSETITTTLAFQNDTLASEQPEPAYFDLDNSCPVDEKKRAELISQLAKDTSQARVSTGEKFNWDTDYQGYLKAAYSIGHMMFQVLGGRLSEVFGSHLIMSSSAIFIGLCCLSAPYLASISFYLFFVDLFVLGCLGSFMTPALITLFSNWLSPGEKSMTMSLYLVSSRLGQVFSSALFGYLIQAQYSWRYLFLTAGWMALAFGAMFFCLCTSQPQDHFAVSRLELEYLATKNRFVRERLERSTTKKSYKLELKQNSSNKDQQVALESNKAKENHKRAKSNAPWAAILTNRPVWAFVFTKFCVKFAGDTVQNELPVYLKRVMHFSSKSNGLINAWNYAIFCFSCLNFGYIAKRINKKRPFGLNKTASRKIFQAIASFGVSIILIAISMSICNGFWTQVFLMLMFAITAFSTCGEAQIPMDITERYSGTIHAIASSLAISGIIEPILIGYITKGRAADRDSWNYIWFGASLISFLGGLIFLLFAEAEIQPFDNIGDEKKLEEPEQDKSNDQSKTLDSSSQKDSNKEI